MTLRVPAVDLDAPIVVVDIGNTNTTLARWKAGKVHGPVTVGTHAGEAVLEALQAQAKACPKGRPTAVVAACVVPEAIERIRSLVLDEWDQAPLVVRDDIPLPIDLGVEDPKLIGADRACAAGAAYAKIQQACAIVDFGTAVTVDLVDDDGVLVGGAILPGLHLQFRALHEHTAALPAVARAVPDSPYGRNTTEAIQTGVCRGLAGAIRGLIEGYATSLNRWPQVVATGGDLEFMAPHCNFLDSLVPHLTVEGIGLAYQKFLADKGV